MIGIDERQRAEHEDGDRHDVLRWHRGSEYERDRNSCREHAHGVGERTRDHEDDRCKAACPNAKPLLEQGVRGDEIALVVPRQQRVRDDDAPQQITRRDLEEAEIGGIGQPGDADERQRARLRGDYGEENRPPRNRASRYEIVFRVLLIAAEPDSEECRRDQVRGEYNKIEGGEIGLHFTALDLCC